MIKDFFTRCDTKPLLLYSLFAVLAIHILLVFSPWTCISTPYFRFDSSVYAVIGEGCIRAGLVPYRDFFDHKGPFVYSFYALAASCGYIKLGLTLLQTIWLTISLILVYRLSRIYLLPSPSWLIVSIFLVLFISFIGEGANTEEISLPFSLLPLYIIIKNLRENFSFSRGVGICFLEFVAIGFCIGILFMIRVNNAVTPCVCCLVLALYMTFNQRWYHLLAITATCCLGCGIVLATYAAYLYSLDALEDYWYCNVIFNMKYASTNANFYRIVQHCLRIPYILLIPFCIWQHKNLKIKSWWEIGLLVTLSIFSFACTCMGGLYLHYHFLNIPACIYVGIMTICYLQPKRRGVWFNVFLLAGLLLCSAISVAKGGGIQSLNIVSYPLRERFHPSPNSFVLSTYNSYHEATTLSHLIPEEEKRDFLCYNMFGSEYLYMNALPACRFFILQDFLRTKDDNLKNLMANEYRKSMPKWVLSRRQGHQNKNEHDNSSFIPWDKYELFTQTKLYELYRLKK